jgi:hypothetical protein
LVLVGVLKEETGDSYEWLSIFPTFTIPKKNEVVTIRVFIDFRKIKLIVETSTISYSKDWEHDLFSEINYHCFDIELNYRLSPY